MSGGLLAVLPLGGEKVDKSVVARMLAVMAPRGRDGSNLRLCGNAALGFQHFHTTPEDLGTTQPFAVENETLSILFDGRLDNRDELLGSAGAELIGANGIGDGLLVLHLYQRFGTAIFPRLLGAFALVLQDRVRGEVYCIRDITGDRTLFYCYSDCFLLVASEEAALLEHPRQWATVSCVAISQITVDLVAFVIACLRDSGSSSQSSVLRIL